MVRGPQRDHVVVDAGLFDLGRVLEVKFFRFEVGFVQGAGHEGEEIGG